MGQAATAVEQKAGTSLNCYDTLEGQYYGQKLLKACLLHLGEKHHMGKYTSGVRTTTKDK